MKVKCAVKGCESTIETDSLPHPVSPSFRFICSGRSNYGDDNLAHTREQQLKAVGRCYDPKKDEEDGKAHFQDYQFDKKLDRTNDANSVAGGGEGKYESPVHD